MSTFDIALPESDTSPWKGTVMIVMIIMYPQSQPVNVQVLRILFCTMVHTRPTPTTSIYDVDVGKTWTLPPTPTSMYYVGAGKTNILPPTPT